MLPKIGILYVKEATDRVGYNSLMVTRSTRCDTTYIKKADMEHPHEWKIITLIEQTGEDHF